MHILSRRALPVIGAFLLLQGPGIAQEPDTLAGNIGFQLLEEPVNPRNIAMGSAGTALAGGGFAYYNPALLHLLGTSYVSADYGQYSQGDLQRGSIEAGWTLSRWFAGAAFTTFSINDIIFADERGISDIAGSWRTSLLALDVGFRARNFGMGVCLNGAQEGIGGFTAYAFSLSGGMVYGILPGKLSVGAAGFHAGTSTGMLAETQHWGEGARLPLSARGGLAWSDTLGRMRYGAAADVVYRNVNKQIMLPIGVEVWPVPAVAVRAGKRFGHPTELVNFGIGLCVTPLEVDLSFVLPRLVSDVELKWQIGLTYSIAAAKPAAPAPKPTTPRDTVQAAPPARQDSLQPPEPVADSATSPADTIPSAAPDSAAPHDTLVEEPSPGPSSDAQGSDAGRETVPGMNAPSDSAAVRPSPAAVDSTAR